MKNGSKFFGFIVGVLSGGLFTLFTAKRKGEDVRKDVFEAIKNKGNVTQVLLEEMKSLGQEARKIAEDFGSSVNVKEYKDMAKDKFDQLYSQAQSKMQLAVKNFEEEWDMLRNQVTSQNSDKKPAKKPTTGIKKKSPSKKAATPKKNQK